MKNFQSSNTIISLDNLIYDVEIFFTIHTWNTTNSNTKNKFQQHIYMKQHTKVYPSPRTKLITRKSLVVHEFPARVCCGGVLWVSVPSGVVGCGSVWLLQVSLCVCVLHQPSAIFWYRRYGGSWRTKGVHQILCEIG